ncbi:MAG: hypothetical protein PV362_19255 [Providencia heimbachae]|nr:hypothetical protein [Providencia heimbachae]
MEHEGIEYEFSRGSDIVRDGMFLELNIANTNPLKQLAEIFYSDITHKFTVNCMASDIPLIVFEQFIEIAKRNLPPMTK